MVRNTIPVAIIEFEESPAFGYNTLVSIENWKRDKEKNGMGDGRG